MRDLMFIAAILAAVPLAINRPHLAVALWAYLSLLDPNFFLYGLGNSVPFVKGAAGLTILSVLLSREKIAPRLDVTTVLALLFLAVAGASQITSFANSNLGWDILDKLWKIVALNVLIVSCVRTRLRIHVLILTICLGVGFNGAGEALKYLLSGAGHKIEGTPNWGDNNQVALIVLMTMPLLQYVRDVSQERLVRLGALGGIILFAVCVIASASRGGLLGLVVIGLAGMLASRQKVRYLVGALIVGWVVIQTAPESWWQRMDTIQAADQDSSFMGRVIVWKLSTLIALDHPLLGGGLHAVQVPNVWAAYVSQFDRLSFIPTDAPDINPHAAHSIYFEVLGDTGFLGLFIFLGMIAASFYSNWQITAAARGRPDLDWAVSLGRQVRVSLLVFVVSGALLSAAYHDLIFILFALSSALRAAVATAPRPQLLAEAPPEMAGWRARRMGTPSPVWRRDAALGTISREQAGRAKFPE